MSYAVAFMETLTIAHFPYYDFEDRDMAYTVGSAFYGLYFVVSFPVYFALDEATPPTRTRTLLTRTRTRARTRARTRIQTRTLARTRTLPPTRTLSPTLTRTRPLPPTLTRTRRRGRRASRRDALSWRWRPKIR